MNENVGIYLSNRCLNNNLIIFLCFKYCVYRSASYLNWGPSEPNGGRKENCLHLFKVLDWKLNDISCVHRAGYICEIANIN